MAQLIKPWTSFVQGFNVTVFFPKKWFHLENYVCIGKIDGWAVNSFKSGLSKIVNLTILWGVEPSKICWDFSVGGSHSESISIICFFCCFFVVNKHRYWVTECSCWSQNPAKDFSSGPSYSKYFGWKITLFSTLEVIYE